MPLHSHIPDQGLILTSSLLTRLQLIQIPATDRQAALILIHALSEIRNLRRTRLRLRLLVRLVRSVLFLLLREILVVGGRCGLLGTAAEEPTDRVADGGADCYATMVCRS